MIEMESLEQVRSRRWCYFYSLLMLMSCVILGSLAQPVDDDRSESDRIIYDQRQSGKYNIHLSIKDVAIIEMNRNAIDDETYNEGDYYYDENDLTVNPIHLTLSPPKKSTTSASTTTPTTTPTTTSTNIITTTTTKHSVSAPTAALVPSVLNSTGNSYSPNLLADIAATGTTINKDISTSTSHSTTLSGKPHSVVILTTTESIVHRPISNRRQTLVPVKPEDIAGRTKDIPISAWEKRDDQKAPQSRITSGRGDSRIFKFKVRRAHQQSGGKPTASGRMISRGCRPHQYRDVTGNCRNKRSSSFL